MRAQDVAGFIARHADRVAGLPRARQVAALYWLWLGALCIEFGDTDAMHAHEALLAAGARMITGRETN